MKSALIWLLLLCNLGFGPAEQVNDPNVPAQDPVVWQAPSSAVEEPITSAWLEKNIRHITLDLYYMDPWTLTRDAVNVDRLKTTYYDAHVTVGTDMLFRHKELLGQMLDTPVQALDDKVYPNARIYYAICDDSGKVLFDVAMWGWGDDNIPKIFVNGVPCEEEDVFYDVALAFLPPDAVSDLEECLKG